MFNVVLLYKVVLCMTIIFPCEHGVCALQY